jgi:hypothetical protein
VAEPLESAIVRCGTVDTAPTELVGPTAAPGATAKPASLLPLWAGVSKTANVSLVCWAMAVPSGVSGAGVWTWSCLNMEAMSEAEEDAVTGLGLKMGVVALSGWRVTMLMTWTGCGPSGESV